MNQVDRAEISRDEHRANTEREIRERFLQEMVPCLRELGLKPKFRNVRYVRQTDGTYKLRITK